MIHAKALRQRTWTVLPFESCPPRLERHMGIVRFAQLKADADLSRVDSPIPRSSELRSNRQPTTGVTMGPFKKCDTRNRLSASQNKSQRSFRQVGHTIKADFSEIKPEETIAKRLAFAQDFLLEHSVSGLHKMKIEMSGSSVISPKERSESCQYFGFPS